MFPGLFPAFGSAEALPPLTGMVVWLKTPIACLVDMDDLNSTTHLWLDSSGNGIDGVAPGGTNPKPIYHDNIVDGLPAVDFFTNEGTLISLVGFNAIATGWSGANIFYVLKLNADPPSALGAGISVMGTDGNPDFFPFNGDGHVYDGSFSNARKDTGNPSVDLSLWHVYDISSATNDWKNYFDNVQFFSTATNTFVNNLSPFQEPSIGCNNGSIAFKGYMAEIIIYDHILDGTERTTLFSYFAARFPTIGL